MRIIVNADDCGMSKTVNEHIEQAIIAGKISSTTVMANMEDFEGAVKLYKQYREQISFGWHINLTEGEPLLRSQVLLDCGYYVENDGRVIFNGKSFWKKRLTKEMKKDIRYELIAQFEKLKDNGIEISHADSHHHIHTCYGLMFMVPSLLQELGINKMRRMRNYVPFSLSYLARNMVSGLIKLGHTNIKMADTFCSYDEFIKDRIFPVGNTVELECHPGHPRYANEEELIMATDIEKLRNATLIPYFDL